MILFHTEPSIPKDINIVLMPLPRDLNNADAPMAQFALTSNGNLYHVITVSSKFNKSSWLAHEKAIEDGNIYLMMSVDPYFYSVAAKTFKCEIPSVLKDLVLKHEDDNIDSWCSWYENKVQIVTKRLNNETNKETRTEALRLMWPYIPEIILSRLTAENL